MFKRIVLKSYDSTELVADHYETQGAIGALFAHGITSERTEAGLYTHFAERLNARGIAAVSLDLRSHGESSGKQEEFLLSGAINDICSGIDFLLSVGVRRILLIAASFSGGLSIRAAELKNESVSHLILLNPRLTYTPWIKDPAFWVNGRLSKEAQKSMEKRGFIERNGFKLGRAMVNELLSFDPIKGLSSLEKPILYIHGTEDSVIPIESTRENYKQNNQSELIEIPGAQHGFTDPETDDPHSERSQGIRLSVVENAIKWVDERFLENQ